MGMYGGWHGGGILVAAIIFVVPLWKIVTKAGFQGAWALLALVPLVNIVALWVFAFSKWPTERTNP
jgi:hypothetical protein